MRYLSSAPFSIGPAAKSTACEKCVWGTGDHAEWCIEHGIEHGWVEFAQEMTRDQVRQKYGDVLHESISKAIYAFYSMESKPISPIERLLRRP